jgi:PAS domain S-box-containing protein
MKKAPTIGLLPRTSIRTRLAGLVLCAMLPLIGLMGATLVLIKAKDIEIVQQAALVTAKVVADNTDRFLGDTASLLRALAGRPAFRALDPEHCDPEIVTFLTRHAGYRDVSTDTLDGTVICSATSEPPSGRHPPVAGTQWFARALARKDTDDVIFGKPLFDPISGAWVLVAAAPIRDTSGTVRGFVVLPIDLHHFEPLKRGTSLPAGSFVTILDDDGIVVARSSDSEAWAGRNLAYVEIDAQALAGTEGVGFGMAVTGRRIFAFAPVPAAHWRVIAAVLPKAAFEATNQAFLLVGLGSVGLLGLVAVLGFLLARGIDTPLRKMASLVEMAADGRTDRRLDTGGPAEIGKVALQFNKMLDARQRVEEALRESESHFRQLADCLPVLMWLADENRQCSYVNKPWLDFTGMTLTQALGAGWAAVLHPDDRQHSIDTYVRTFDARHPFALEFRVRRHDGEYRWLYDQGIPRHDAAGTFLGYVGGSIDITDRKLAEERLVEARKAAEAADRAKSVFLAMMSHELRTPMTGVIGMADFLSETPLNPDQKLYIDTMRSSARTLLTVLNDILDYSKIDANRLTLDCITFDAVALTTEAVRLFWTRAEDNACTLTLDTGDLTTLVVLGDPNRIKQVLGNLIGNAVKFTRNGTITVRLRCLEAGERLRLGFDVEDTGIGISEDDQKRLFQPFSQTDTGATRKFGGTGLGLAICKRLVDLMGGEIGVTSRLGRGSLFRFTCLVDRGRQKDLASEPEPSPAVPPLTILLAEDNPINRMIVKIGLEQRRHRVSAVENGVHAYEAAAKQRFDVILMDMQMPVMDGTEATRRIRTLAPPFSEVPIVALTADALVEHRATYMEAGLTDFLTKPVEWGKVDAVLARLSARAKGSSAPNTGSSGPAADEHEAPLIDRARLLSIHTLMAETDFSELIRELIDCARDEMSQLKAAIDQGDLPLAYRVAHTLKGMFLNIGGVRIATLAHDLQACRDREAANALFQTLTIAIEDTVAELGRFNT